MLSELQNFDYEESLMKGVLAGAVGYGLAMTVLQAGGTNVDAFGMSMDTSALIGTAVGLSSVVTDLTHSMILKNIQADQKYATIESGALNLLLAGASTSIILGASTGEEIELTYSMFAGGASIMAADYIYYNLIYPERAGLSPGSLF